MEYIYLFLLIILILIGFYYKNTIENFEDKLFIPNKDYDKQYVDFYNLVWSNSDNLNTDINSIKDYLGNNKSSKILDGGCGVGNFTGNLNNLNYKVIGVDKSKEMLKKAVVKYPKSKFIRGNLNNKNLFSKNEFSVIYLGLNVLNLNQKEDIIKIIQNCNKWLKKDGYLIVKILDKNNLIYYPRKYSQFYIDNKKYKHSFTYFKNFLYNNWIIPQRTTTNFYEKIVLKDGRSRIKINKLFILERQNFIKIIENNGFNLDKLIDNKLTYKGTYLGIFKKKNN